MPFLVRNLYKQTDMGKNSTEQSHLRLVVSGGSRRLPESPPPDHPPGRGRLAAGEAPGGRDRVIDRVAMA